MKNSVEYSHHSFHALVKRTGLAALLPAARRTFLVLAFCVSGTAGAMAASPLPTNVPPGTKLVVGDQKEELQTLMAASGQQAKLASSTSYANFIGGPAVLEAFRAGALDLATVGNAPPIQAQASGQDIPIVLAIATDAPDYKFALRPGLSLSTLKDLRGKRIAYAEGTGRQPFVLLALKAAGLTKQDVTLIPLRASDFPDAVRSGQVDVAALDEPFFSRYLVQEAGHGPLGMPNQVYDKLPHGLTYLYARRKALNDPAKAAAIRDFVVHAIAAYQWEAAKPDQWVTAYYVNGQNLSKADGFAVVKEQGTLSFPALASLIAQQQELIDVIYAAGDIPKRLDAKQEFDLRFDDVIAQAAHRS